MSKRRVFDIDFDDTTDTVPAGTHPPERRAPMDAATHHTAQDVAERARAENDRLAHEHVRLKQAGLVTDLIPLDMIDTTKLIRDRSATVDPEIEELEASIRDVGLSNPIRVEANGHRFELIQGFRRLSAFRALYAATGDDRFARIPATLNAVGDDLDALYRRMVDENLVRRDISFAEMAQLARAYAADPGSKANTSAEAVQILYASAGRQKRNYIRRFANLLDMIGKRLSFPEALPRALGLDLERRLSEEPGFAARLKGRLAAAFASTPDKEIDVLRRVLKETDAPTSAQSPKAATTLRFDVSTGTGPQPVKLAARPGRVEVAMNRDFSALHPARLEAATAAFLRALDEDR